MQAESAAANLRDIETNFSSDQESKIVDQELPNLGREIDARHEESSKILTTAPSLETLHSLNRDWEKLHETISNWNRDLLRQTTQLDEQITRLALLQQTWEQTLQLTKGADTPAPILEHVHAVINSIAQTRELAERRRAEILDLQNRVSEVDGRVVLALASVQRAREQALSRIFTRDSPPVWDAELRATPSESLIQESRNSFSTQLQALRAYIAREPEKFAAHAVVLVLLIVALYAIRRHVHPWVQEEPAIARAVRVLHAPIATALLLSIVSGGWIYPEAPRLLWALFGVAALIPAVIIMRQLLEPYLFPILNALMVFFFIDRLRMIAAALPLLSRFLFLVETLGGIIFLVWLLRPARWNTIPENNRDDLWKTIHYATKIALGIFCVSVLANILGYMGLSKLLGSSVLRSGYLAVILYASLRVLDLFTLFALRVPPLAKLSLVQRHQKEIWEDTRWFLEWAALIAWALATLEFLAVRSLLFRIIAKILTTSLTLGSISVSLLHLLEFGLTIWASFLVSRFVRFILDEDVYPRVELARGLPYAISTMLHYAILVWGFIFALGALGIDMTKFTILAGAFGVGLGFGMQNIMNNFFSGLILLFERPIKVGDVIQIDDASGVVERIGIRASTIRTTAGAEVIVPNGSLISSKVTNWTFSARQRSIEMPISVDPAADPQKVIALLEAVAKTDPHIAKTPPPRALVVKMGAASLDLELHASTDRIEDWNQVRSDLAVTLSAALRKENIGIR